HYTMVAPAPRIASLHSAARQAGRGKRGLTRSRSSPARRRTADRAAACPWHAPPHRRSPPPPALASPRPSPAVSRWAGPTAAPRKDGEAQRGNSQELRWHRRRDPKGTTPARSLASEGEEYPRRSQHRITRGSRRALQPDYIAITIVLDCEQRLGGAIQC